MKGDSFEVIVIDGAMCMAETDVANAGIGALTDQVHVIQNAAGDLAFGIRRGGGEQMKIGPDRHVVESMMDGRTGSVLELVSLLLQRRRTRLLVRNIAMQKERVAESVIKSTPFKSRVFRDEFGQSEMQKGMVVVIAEQKMNFAITCAFQEFLKPANRCVGRRFRISKPRPTKVEDIAPEDATVRLL